MLKMKRNEVIDFLFECAWDNKDPAVIALYEGFVGFRNMTDAQLTNEYNEDRPDNEKIEVV